MVDGAGASLVEGAAGAWLVLGAWLVGAAGEAADDVDGAVVTSLLWQALRPTMPARAMDAAAARLVRVLNMWRLSLGGPIRYAGRTPGAP
ncbi:hypothetical protein GCM10027070_15220 [Barrientosiimonas humi]